MSMGATDDTDALLVARVALGDEAALATLYDRYAHPVYRAAYRRLGDPTLAEEVLQDTYLALWNRAELFDPAQGSLLTWLSTIARNRAVDRLRALGRRPAAVPIGAVLGVDEVDGAGIDRLLTAGVLMASGSRSVDPAELLDDGAARDEIRRALSAIPRNERTVLELAYDLGLSQSEIAARLGWPLGTVKTRTRRALLRLRDALTGILGPSVVPPPSQELAAEEIASAGGVDAAR
jgi:RNA polymerase sigma-70 factor (ECF subfamily)